MTLIQTVATLEIADELVRICTLASSLGLKVVSVGDLNLLPSPDLLDSWLPAVLVKPLDHTKEWAAPGCSYNLKNMFKIYYLRRYADSEDIIRQEITGLLTIEQYLQQNILTLPSCAWPSNMCLLGAIVDKGNYDEEANAFFAEANIPITALSLGVTVDSRAQIHT